MAEYLLYLVRACSLMLTCRPLPHPASGAFVSAIASVVAHIGLFVVLTQVWSDQVCHDGCSGVDTVLEGANVLSEQEWWHPEKVQTLACLWLPVTVTGVPFVCECVFVTINVPTEHRESHACADGRAL